jgi:ankyrin repeat protein
MQFKILNYRKHRLLQRDFITFRGTFFISSKCLLSSFLRSLCFSRAHSQRRRMSRMLSEIITGTDCCRDPNERVGHVHDLPAELYLELTNRMDWDTFRKFFRTSPKIMHALNGVDALSVELRNKFNADRLEPLMEAALRGVYKRDFLQKLVPADMTENERNMTFLVVHHALTRTLNILVRRELNALPNQANVHQGDLAHQILRLASIGSEPVIRKRIALLDSIAWTNGMRQVSPTLTDDLIVAIRADNPIFLSKLTRIITGPILNSTNAQGWTPLSFAASEGKLEAVRILVEAGAAIDGLNSRDEGGVIHTPLCYATAGNHPEVVRYLAEKGALLNCDPEDATEGTVDAIYVAIRQNNAEMVRLILELGSELSPWDDAIENQVVFEEKPELIRVAVEVKGPGYTQVVSVLEAIIRMRDVDGVERLLEFGVSVDHCSESGDTPLMAAIRGVCEPDYVDDIEVGEALPNDPMDILNLMLARDPNLNARNNITEATALMIAAKSCPWGIFNRLRDMGADDSLADRFGMNILSYAILGKNWDVARRFVAANVPLQSPLVYSQLFVNRFESLSAMAATAFSDDIALVDYALNQLQTDVVSLNGYSAFTIATIRKNREMMEHLWRRGVEVWSEPIGSRAKPDHQDIQCPTGENVTQIILGISKRDSFVSSMQIMCSNGAVSPRIGQDADHHVALPEVQSGITRLVVGTNGWKYFAALSYANALAGVMPEKAKLKIKYPANEEMSAFTFQARQGRIEMENLALSVQSPLHPGCPLVGLRFWSDENHSRVQFRFAC